MKPSESQIAKDIKSSPVLEFRDNKHLNEYLRWWQKKLFLTDWIIEAGLYDEVLDPDTGDELCGRVTMVFDNNSAYIYILRREEYKDGNVGMTKFCSECSLVHELLHLRYNWLFPPDNMEGKYFDTVEHQNLEKMAKSLIMTKYDLDFDWFYPERSE